MHELVQEGVELVLIHLHSDSILKTGNSILCVKWIMLSIGNSRGKKRFHARA